jgi:hypothetical protein
MSVLKLSAHLTSVQKRSTSSFLEELPVPVILIVIAFHFYKLINMIQSIFTLIIVLR